jgi:hypothetical protein
VADPSPAQLTGGSRSPDPALTRTWVQRSTGQTCGVASAPRVVQLLSAARCPPHYFPPCVDGQTKLAPPCGAHLEPLWNLCRLFRRGALARQRRSLLSFSWLFGGRTRTRTLDPLIKSHRIAADTSGHEPTFLRRNPREILALPANFAHCRRHGATRTDTGKLLPRRYPKAAPSCHSGVTRHCPSLPTLRSAT